MNNLKRALDAARNSDNQAQTTDDTESSSLLLKTPIVMHNSFKTIAKRILFLHNCAADNKASGGLLFGNPGVGKTTLTQHINDEINRLYRQKENSRPVIIIELTKRTNTNALLKSIVHKLGGEYKSKATEVDLIHQCAILAQELGLKLLIVDESHNLMSGHSHSDPEGVFDTLKSLINTSHCSILLAGTPKIKNVFDYLPESKRDIKRRFKMHLELQAFSLSSWKEYIGYIKGLLDFIECDTSSLQTDLYFFKALLYTTDGNQNEVTDILNAALEFRANEKQLTIDDIKAGIEVYYMDRNGFLLSPAELDRAINQFYNLRNKEISA